MRRADRLFQLIQCLHHNRATTALTLAEKLQVSERTIYRDIQDLTLSGVPIISETGIGYRLMPGYQLSPLMFNEEELSALLLGIRMVNAWTDKTLADAANQALQKIEHVIPNSLKPELERHDIIVPDFSSNNQHSTSLKILRSAIRLKQKVFFSYTRADKTTSNRSTLPLGLFFWGKVWTLVAWCELRNSFRHFRLDRIENIAMLDEKFTILPGRSLNDYLCNEWGVDIN